MSLLSKLFGGNKDAENAAKNILNSFLGGEERTTSYRPEQAPARPTRYSRAPSGFSWGETMPDEENQYNFNGHFTQYFESVFQRDFPQYEVEKSLIDGGKRVLYTFYAGQNPALVVELMPESSSAYKIREGCERQRVPYRRFYYDHDGWWNTRAYVVKRIRDALNG